MLVLRKKARSDGTELPDMEVIKSLRSFLAAARKLNYVGIYNLYLHHIYI